MMNLNHLTMSLRLYRHRVRLIIMSRVKKVLSRKLTRCTLTIFVTRTLRCRNRVLLLLIDPSHPYP